MSKHSPEGLSAENGSEHQNRGDKNMRKWIQELTYDATFWLVLVFISASAIAAYVLAVDFGQKARTADLSAAARAQSELLTAARSFYSREVVDKLYSSQDVSVSHDYHDKDLTIPAPVSMISN